jgi:hypothetical protein
MKYIITESQLDRATLKFLNTQYGNLEPYENSKWPMFTFFMKDGKVIFEYHKRNGVVFVSYEDIWSILESFFGFNYDEIQSLTKEWMEKQYNLDVKSSYRSALSNRKRWRDITN